MRAALFLVMLLLYFGGMIVTDKLATAFVDGIEDEYRKLEPRYINKLTGLFVIVVSIFVKTVIPLFWPIGLIMLLIHWSIWRSK